MKPKRQLYPSDCNLSASRRARRGLVWAMARRWRSQSNELVSSLPDMLDFADQLSHQAGGCRSRFGAHVCGIGGGEAIFCATSLRFAANLLHDATF